MSRSLATHKSSNQVSRPAMGLNASTNQDDVGTPPPRQRAAVLTVWYGILTIITAVYIVMLQMPDTTATIPYRATVVPIARALTPQGWAFFTRSPREDVFSALMPNGHDGWTAAGLGPNGRPSAAFGFNRAARAQGPRWAF